MSQGLTSGRTSHRADYILERGMWRAICRECGWQTSDAQRRQAATLFRAHIQDTKDLIDIDAAERPIELELPASPEVHPHATPEVPAGQADLPT
jgi:hypothetical protein